MCGLIGLVQRFDPNARLPGAREAVSSALSRLEAWSIDDPGAADELQAVAADLDALSLATVGWAGFRTLREGEALRGEASKLASALGVAADEIDGRLADSGRVGSTKAGEALARAVVAARDVAWRLRCDALPNLEKAAGLSPTDPGLKGWFELWRINLVLNQLERLEVRGRDSGGLSTLIRIPGWSTVEADLEAEHAAELERRLKIECLRDGAVLKVDRAGGEAVVAFAHKVAKEVGELGANVRELRGKIRADGLYLRLLALPAAEVQVLAHTRWASNGIINEPNCHPVANDQAGNLLGGRIVLGVLNGDVDNFPTLAGGWTIPAACTTDAKIIPLEVARHLGEAGDLDAAFRLAVSSFEGSTAIGVLASDDPSCVQLALRGSGQAIYVGALEGGGYLFASELYGVVELAPRFHKLNGERGEVVRVAADGLRATDYAGNDLNLDVEAFKAAPIATRDIDRGGFSHYFLKEINEAPRSVERTLRGKFVLESDDSGDRARFLLGEDVVPPAVKLGLTMREGQLAIRRVFVIGQGTAAVAGLAAADFMGTILRPAGIEVRGMPATELSGFYLDRLDEQTLIVAVSQSGTTTDTNRTVDLARERGAHVIGIVNRRGSDLVDKSHGVLYTSDGRDIEMSVASTKAFYCQVAAGYVLGLQLASLAGAIDDARLYAHLLRIQDLPRCLRTILEESRERVRAAAQLALERRHWTVVGSGPLFQAAREIRIKLSELCYKSVSVDTIEDKKHIDLSSEPLILVCAAGLSGSAAADAVKEVAIFKAHAAIPVVICDRGETRFAEYAVATIEVPATSPEVALLLNTIAGHLFSYEVARAIDACAAPLRRARDLTAAAQDAMVDPSEDPSEAEAALSRYRRALSPVAREVFGALARREWDAGLGVDDSHRLTTALRLALGQLPWQEGGLAGPPSAHTLLDHVHGEVVRTFDVLRRPIDAIKHQAKTVTVGISRASAAHRPPAGILVEALEGCGIAEAAIADQDAAALAALEAAIDTTLGAVHYRLAGLSPLGAPTDTTTITAAQKSGVAAGIESRADHGVLLSGTKRMIVRAPRVWVGHGKRDGRSLVLCPVYRDGAVAGLGLIHVRFKAELDLRARVRALKAVGRYEDLRCAVTEWDVSWSDDLLVDFSVEELMTDSVDRLAGTLQSARQDPAVWNGGESS